MANTVGSKGQVVVEKPIRDALGVEPGFVTVQSLVGDHVEIRFYPPEHTRSLRGALEGLGKSSISPEDWSRERQRAWHAAAASAQGEGESRR